MGINVDYILTLKEQVSKCTSCAELQEASAKIVKALQEQLQGMLDQMAVLEPILALLSPPSIDDIVTWVADFIKAVLEPMIKPYYEYQLQLVELTAAITEIADLIQGLSSKFPNCEIVPPIIPSIP